MKRIIIFLLLIIQIFSYEIYMNKGDECYHIDENVCSTFEGRDYVCQCPSAYYPDSFCYCVYYKDRPCLNYVYYEEIYEMNESTICKDLLNYFDVGYKGYIM